MSCDVAVSAFLMFASMGPSGPQPLLIPAAVSAAPPSVAKEPLFADIVGRAGRLKAEIEAYRTPALAGAPEAKALAHFDAVQKQIAELAALDMQGHVELVKRGSTDDLKCILKGISQDLPVKLKDLQDAKTGKAQDLALRDMAYLLNDNVEVITAPPRPAA
jgi:hypothetical protein